MIYRNSYFKKEMRQVYSENSVSSNRKMFSALFLGLLSFALYLIVQTLQQSVLADAVPEIMQPSFFSTLYIYIHMALLFDTAYFILHYDYLFFSEIRRNAWYLLIQMDYHPVVMFYSKLFALLYSVFLVYTGGFIATVLFTFFLKYHFILAYLPSLYLTGLIDLILIATLSMVFSLYAKTAINARYWIFFSALMIMVLKVALGQYNILANRVSMQNIVNLFDIHASLYMPVALAIILICCLLCLYRARNLAKYYTVPTDKGLVPPEVTIARFDPKAGKMKPAFNRNSEMLRRKIFDTAFNVFLIVFICAALAFNGIIILINTSTPGQEVAIRGVIPFVFQSNTMEPGIMTNDLTYFQKIDSRYPVQTGQVVLFTENNVVYVERVMEKSGDQLAVDIDNYPPMTQIGAMKKTVPRHNVQGVYTGRSRWLGALILFANTIVGRLVFLLVPTILLFYHAQIYKFLKKEK